MSSDKPPIIDVHCHAFYIPDKPTMDVPHGLRYPNSYDEYKNQCLQYFREYNIIAVPSGAATQDWHQTAPDIIIPGAEVITKPEDAPIKSLRRQHEEGKLKVLSELAFQFNGIAPNDSEYDPYFALADELDLPVVLHIGIVTPGIVYTGYPKRARAWVGLTELIKYRAPGIPDEYYSFREALADGIRKRADITENTLKRLNETLGVVA